MKLEFEECAAGDCEKALEKDTGERALRDSGRIHAGYHVRFRKMTASER